MRVALLCLVLTLSFAHADGLVLSNNTNVIPMLMPLQMLADQQPITVDSGSLIIVDLPRNRWLSLTAPCSTILTKPGCAKTQTLPTHLHSALSRLPQTLNTIAAFDDNLPSRTISARLTRANQQSTQLRKSFGDEAALLYLLDAQVAAQDGLGIQHTLNQLVLLWPSHQQIGALLAHIRRLDLAVGTPSPGAQVVVKPLELQ